MTYDSLTLYQEQVESGSGRHTVVVSEALALHTCT